MSKRILVVENQEDDRQIIRDLLAGTDYEITEAQDGEHALAAATPTTDENSHLPAAPIWPLSASGTRRKSRSASVRSGRWA